MIINGYYFFFVSIKWESNFKPKIYEQKRPSETSLIKRALRLYFKGSLRRDDEKLDISFKKLHCQICRW